MFCLVTLFIGDPLCPSFVETQESFSQIKYLDVPLKHYATRKLVTLHSISAEKERHAVEQIHRGADYQGIAGSGGRDADPGCM